jgi:hypothetical protein
VRPESFPRTPSSGSRWRARAISRARGGARARSRSTRAIRACGMI